MVLAVPIAINSLIQATLYLHYTLTILSLGFAWYNGQKHGSSLKIYYDFQWNWEKNISDLFGNKQKGDRIGGDSNLLFLPNKVIRQFSMQQSLTQPMLTLLMVNSLPADNRYH